MEMIFSRQVILATVLRSTSRQIFNNLPVKATCTYYIKNFSIFEKCKSYEPRKYNYAATSSQFFKHRKSLLPETSLKLVYYSDEAQSPKPNSGQSSNVEKLSKFQKMKQLMKDYWHVLIPVHVITSIGWGTIFYLAIRNGVDIAQIMENLHLSEKYVQSIRDSKASNILLAYLLYKISTPIRYTVTIGGTTLAIRYLNKFGYFKAPQLGNWVKKKTQSSAFTTKRKDNSKTGSKSEQHSESSKT